jgi:hypothetical protein
MPKEHHLKATGNGSLANAIHQHGGFKKFATTHSYRTFRKPNGFYKEFSVLSEHLVAWVRSFGIRGIMPTAQQLKESAPPRHDLVAAISTHGGFAAVAQRTGLRMSHDKKPDGFYDDIQNVAREVYSFIDRNNLTGVMPTASQLGSSGNSGLVNGICANGGFWSVAKFLGLSPNRKPPDYWTEQTVDQEVRDYLEQRQIDGMMPTDFELRETDRADLAVAIARHGGGMLAVAQRLGLGTRAPKPDRYWEDPETIRKELLDYIQDHGVPGSMPTQASLMNAGRADLAIAISRHGGGWTEMAESLNLQLTQLPKGHWSDIENVRSAILALNEWRGRQGVMPTKTDLDREGEFGLSGAISKLGGYPTVAAMFGLSAPTDSLSPRSREELVLAHELKLFFEVDLEDHTIHVADKTYDLDILIRAHRLAIEYDSYYWHKETDAEERDRRKTNALEADGWTVIRVREKPLSSIHDLSLIVEKGRHKEICNRVLLRIEQLLDRTTDSVRKYLLKSKLQNVEACETYISDLLRARQGDVTRD